MNVPECLDNLSPTWASILRDNEADEVVGYTFDSAGEALEYQDRMGEIPNAMKYDIDNFACCIVGECYLGDNGYQQATHDKYCGTCTAFSMSLPDRLADIIEDIDEGYDGDDSLF